MFPSRSGVLASELAEVRVGLAGGVVPLGKKPEIKRTVLLMGQGRSVLRDNVSMAQGAPDLLPTASGKPPVREPGLCFVRLLGLWASCTSYAIRAGRAHSRASNDLQGWPLSTLTAVPGAQAPCAEPHLPPSPQPS